MQYTLMRMPDEAIMGYKLHILNNLYIQFSPSLRSSPLLGKEWGLRSLKRI